MIFCNDALSIDVDNAEVSRVPKKLYSFCYQNVIGRLCGHNLMTCFRESEPVVVRNDGESREWQIYAKICISYRNSVTNSFHY